MIHQGSSKDIVELYMDELFADVSVGTTEKTEDENVDEQTLKSSLEPDTHFKLRPNTRSSAVSVTQPKLKSSSNSLDVANRVEVYRRGKLQALLNRNVYPKVQSKGLLTEPPAPLKLDKNKVVRRDKANDIQKKIQAFSDHDNVEEPVETPSKDTPIALLNWSENGRPEWAQSSFEVLLFRVSGLSLAVPIIALGQIHPITDKLTPIFGQVDWFMGLQETPNGRVRVINTALYVMPERYNPEFLKTAKYVVSINGLGWGLAVDNVQQPTLIDPDDVTWRTDRSKRPWLAGTVKSAMCALLDIPKIGETLQNYKPE